MAGKKKKMATKKAPPKKVAQPAPRPAIAPATLVGKSTHDLDLVFAGLAEPSALQLNGNYAGNILAGGLLDPVVPVAKDALNKIASTFWRGKTFTDGSGSNVWFDLAKGLRLITYRVKLAKSHDDKGRVVQLDYDIPENLPPLRLIRGEARPLGNGIFLARMLFRVKNDWFNVIYFTLVPA